MALARKVSMSRSTEQTKTPTRPAASRGEDAGLPDRFNESVLKALRSATRAAVKSHHDAGRPVHGVVDGKIVEKKPATPQK
jgi:hypothetical protein